MKKKIKTEQNIIIIMDAIKKIMTIFLGPFLTAYFISTSTNSILNIAIYYILKSIIIYTIEKKKYLDSLSDIQTALAGIAGLEKK